MKKPFAAVASALLFSFATAASHAAAPMPSADPAVVAATKDLLTAMKTREMMTGMLATLEQRMPGQVDSSMATVINGNPNLTAEQKAVALKRAEEASRQSRERMHAIFSDPTLVDDMLGEIVPMYAETYTLDELRQLTAFYSSPLGQKMLANTPLLMSRSMEISQRVMLPRIQKAMAQSRQAAEGK